MKEQLFSIPSSNTGKAFICDEVVLPPNPGLKVNHQEFFCIFIFGNPNRLTFIWHPGILQVRPKLSLGMYSSQISNQQGWYIWVTSHK